MILAELEQAVREIRHPVKVRYDSVYREWVALIEWAEPDRSKSRVEGSSKEGMLAAMEAVVLNYWRRRS